MAGILGAVGLISGALSGYFSSQLNTQQSIEDAKTELRAIDAETLSRLTGVETKQDLQYKELAKDTDEIKEDLKELKDLIIKLK